MIEQNRKQNKMKKPVTISEFEERNEKEQKQQVKQINEEEQQQESSLCRQQEGGDSAPLNCLICVLCEDTILSAVECICGHAFCEQCLNNYLSKRKECPICEVKIRGKKGSGNKRLDQFIQDFCTFVGGNVQDNLKKRKDLRKNQLDGQKLENTYPGMEVDVRDENYIWRKGRIVRTLNKINEQRMRVKYLVVEYEQSEKRQQFASSSLRLAKAGFFTQDRKMCQLQHYSSQKIKAIEKLGNPVKRIKKLSSLENKVEGEEQCNQQ